MSRGWYNDPYKHSLASKGIMTKEGDWNEVLVGGRDNPRLSQKPVHEHREDTDVWNAFHTTTDPHIAKKFSSGWNENNKIYELEIDLNSIPNDKILRDEDWSEEMIGKWWARNPRIELDDLEETRPDLVKRFREILDDDIEIITPKELSEKNLLDVFVYPQIDFPYDIESHRLEIRDKPWEEWTEEEKEFPQPVENEVAIFDEELLEDAWEHRKEVDPHEIW